MVNFSHTWENTTTSPDFGRFRSTFPKAICGGLAISGCKSYRQSSTLARYSADRWLERSWSGRRSLRSVVASRPRTHPPVHRAEWVLGATRSSYTYRWSARGSTATARRPGCESETRARTFPPGPGRRSRAPTPRPRPWDAVPRIRSSPPAASRSAWRTACRGVHHLLGMLPRAWEPLSPVAQAMSATKRGFVIVFSLGMIMHLIRGDVL